MMENHTSLVDTRLLVAQKPGGPPVRKSNTISWKNRDRVSVI